MNESAKRYPLGSAGRLAQDNVPTVKEGATIAHVHDLLNSRSKDFASINYIYVLDTSGILKGVVSVRDVFTLDAHKKVEEIMHTSLAVAHPHTDQERVAQIALRENIKAVPVVDRKSNFLGAVLNDTITDIIYEETHEDVAHMAGAPNMPRYKSVSEISSLALVQHRLPWLIFGSIGGLLGAFVVSQFENAMQEHLILASFIPLVMYMGGSSLSQTQAFFIRDLAFIPTLHFAHYAFKQAQATLINALVISGIIYAILVLFYTNGRPEIAYLVSISLFAVLISTILTSLLIPYIFFKLKKDPADGSGPLSTIAQDLIGITLYFSIALLFI